MAILLGAELRRAREEAGLSQEQLARATGIDRAYISELERDKNSPTVDRLVKLSRAMGIRASVLLARAEKLDDIHKKKPNA
jgi:transcriptional regulator with XRE-family HTH domain